MSSKIKRVKFKKSWRRKGSGGYGAYYQVSTNRGIKVLYNSEEYYGTQYFTNATRAARKEVTLMNRAAKTGHAPRGYGVVRVVYPDGRESVGILMQHIIGKVYSNLPYKMHVRHGDWLDNKGHYCVEDFLRKTLKKVRLQHDDLHTSNIMAKTKNGRVTKVYAIDFTPDFVYRT